MARLINADALYEQIAKKEELARQRVLDTPSRMPNGDFNPSAMRYATQLDERTQMKFMLADAPTIDAEPVRHGKWMGTVCSACGESTSFYYDCDCCPHCGARMDETQKKPCDDCQQFDCYGCEYAERKEE